METHSVSYRNLFRGTSEFLFSTGVAVREVNELKSNERKSINGGNYHANAKYRIIPKNLKWNEVRKLYMANVDVAPFYPTLFPWRSAIF